MKRVAVNLLTLVLLTAAFAMLYSSCKDDMEGKLFVVSDKMMIDDYITKKDPSMSMFLDIVDKADMRGTIHAYGRYTCFIPDNAAIHRYLQSEGKSLVDDLTAEECLNMVKYHVVRLNAQRDSMLTTNQFVDGRLPVPTMLSKYLTTRTVGTTTGVVTRVNRQADIIDANIVLANGCIHKIDNVLVPPELTCGEQVQALSDEYSIFKEILEETKWIQRLTDDKTDTSWYTVFVQSNAAFASVGINDIDSLVRYLVAKEVMADTALINNMPSTVNKNDNREVTLWAFAAYHCINDLYYVADLMNVSALSTSAHNQVMMFKVKRDSLLVNEYINEALKKYERGVPIDKVSDNTDKSCYNGVLIEVGGYVGPEKRGPQAVFWEITDQPEFRKNTKYRKQWFSLTREEVESLSEMKVTFASGITYDNATKADDNVGTFYYCYRPAWDSRTHFSFSDALGIKMADIARMDLTMPVLTPGVYTVWVAWRRADVNLCRARATFIENGVEQEMGSVGFHESFDTGKDALVLLAQGMKRYNAKVRSSVLNCRRWGVMTVNTTGRHTLRIDVIERGRSTAMWIDMIHFIPGDNDQLWPRFDFKGNPIYKGTPCEDIEPKNQPGICPADNDMR